MTGISFYFLLTGGTMFVSGLVGRPFADDSEWKCVSWGLIGTGAAFLIALAFSV